MNLYRTLAAVALASAVANASAAPASVTANFSLFTLGGYFPGNGPDQNGLILNGQTINICGSDPTCTSALTDPTSVKVGLSGSSVSFGYSAGGQMNEFSFTGNTTEVAGSGIQNQFKLGSISFTNGGFYPLSFLDFTLTTHSIDSSLDNHTFSGRIRLDVNIPPPSTPEQNADYFTIQDTQGNTLNNLGSVRVYEAEGAGFCPPNFPANQACDVGSVDLIGHINSLHLDSFTNPTGGAFLNSSTTSVLAPSNSIPEPSTLLLSGLCLAALGAVRRYRPQSK